MDLKTWLETTGKGVDDAVTRCLNLRKNGTWSENMITGEVLTAIDTVEPIDWRGSGFHAGFRLFKASGPHETANGDIAMKLDFSAPGAGTIHGTKYFEAKKLYVETGKYGAFDGSQLARMQAKPGHEVLLYRFGQGAGDLLVGTALCIPTPMAVLLEKQGPKALDRTATPFLGVLLGALMGRGLDWDLATAGAFEGFYRHAVKPPSFKVLARLGPLDFVRELDSVLAPEGYEAMTERDPSDDHGHDPDPSNGNGRSKGNGHDLGR